MPENHALNRICVTRCGSLVSHDDQQTALPCMRHKNKENGTTRYRCTNTHCGASTTRTRPDIKTCATFQDLHRYATGPQTQTTLATSMGTTCQILNHRFATM